MAGRHYRYSKYISIFVGRIFSPSLSSSSQLYYTDIIFYDGD